MILRDFQMLDALCARLHCCAFRQHTDNVILSSPGDAILSLGYDTARSVPPSLQTIPLPSMLSYILWKFLYIGCSVRKFDGTHP